MCGTQSNLTCASTELKNTQGTQLDDWTAKYSDSRKCLFSLLIHSTRNAESLFFVGLRLRLQV